MMKQYSRLLATYPLVIGLLIVSVSNVKSDDLTLLYTEAVQQHEWLSQEQKKYLLEAGAHESFVRHLQGVTRSIPDTDTEVYIRAFLDFYRNYIFQNRAPHLLIQDFQEYWSLRAQIVNTEHGISKQQSLLYEQEAGQNDLVVHQLRLQLEQSNRQLQDLNARLARLQQQFEDHKRNEESKYEERKQRAIERTKKIEQLQAENQDQVSEVERLKKLLSKTKAEKKRMSSEQKRLKRQVLDTSSQATLQVNTLQAETLQLQRENDRLRQERDTPTGVCQASPEPAACNQLCLSDGGLPSQKYGIDQYRKKGSNQKKQRKDKFSSSSSSSSSSKGTGGKHSTGNRASSGQKSLAQVSQPAKPDAAKPKVAQDSPEVAVPGNNNYGGSIQWGSRLIACSLGSMTRLLLTVSPAAFAIFAVFAIKRSVESGSGDAHTYSTTENQTQLPKSTALVTVPDNQAIAEPESVKSENVHLPLNKSEPASHSCYLTPDYELIELCLQLPPEKQALMLLVWNLRHNLLVTRYTLYQKQIDDNRLNRFPIDSVLYSEAEGDHFYLLPERFITFSDLEKREQYDFFRLLANTSDSSKVPLSERLKKIALFGAFCGSMPSDLQRQCFVTIETEILQNGYESLHAPIPDRAINPKEAEFSGKAALVASWPLAVNGETISITNYAKTLAILIGEKGALELLHMKAQQAGQKADQIEINMLDDGVYQVFSQLMNKGQPEWIERSEPFITLAGAVSQQQTKVDDVLLLYNANSKMDHLIAVKDGKFVPAAWSIHGLKAQYNQLLLAFMGYSASQQQPIMGVLNSWRKTCQSSNNCPVNFVQSYYNGKPLVRNRVAHRLDNLSESDPLWHVSGLKFCQLKKVRKPLLNQWLRLLSQTIEATWGQNPENTQIEKIADMARLLCGISNSAGSRELTVSCFQQLIEKDLRQPDWKTTKPVSDFFAGFSSVKADGKPIITLAVLRARLGLFRLTDPHFLPSLSYKGRRHFVSHQGGKTSRFLNLPPDRYMVYTLKNDFTLMSASIDLTDSKKKGDVISGSHLFLGTRSDINDIVYLIEPENPYIPTPYPAYPHNRTLYSRDNYQFKAEQFIHTLHHTPCADSKKTGINKQLCKLLVDYTEVELLYDLLQIIKALPASKLKFPELAPWHGELKTNSPEGRVHYRPGDKVKCASKSKLFNSKKSYHLIYERYKSLSFMGKQYAWIFKGYHDLIIKAGIARSVRWKALYHIVSNCGFSCEHEHRACARHILSILQSNDDDVWRPLEIGLEQQDDISRFRYPATASKKASVAKLTRVMVFDRHHRLVRQITLPVMKINGNEGFYPAHFKDPESKWVHEVILKGLTPGTEYRVELFSPTVSDWVPQDELTFTTIADETTHPLKVSVDKLYRVTSGSEQVSYIFFPVQKIRNFDKLTDRYTIWKKLPDMPKLSWEQPIHIKKGKYSF